MDMTISIDIDVTIDKHAQADVGDDGASIAVNIINVLAVFIDVGIHTSTWQTTCWRVGSVDIGRFCVSIGR